MNTKSLLMVTAAVELGAGLLLVAAPSLMATLLLGAELPSPVSVTVARIAGAALLSIGLSCWLERNGDRGPHPAGLVAGALVYNGAVVALLVYSALVQRISGVGLWPVCVLHTALLIWCAACLRARI